MKKVYLSLVLLCLAVVSSFAQNASNYLYTYYTGVPYVSIAGGSGTTATTSISSDDVTMTGVPIGFSFKFCGTTYTQLSACSNGWVCLNNFSGANYPASSGGIGSAGWLFPWWGDDYGVGSTAYYQTSGSSPNRVFTFEWNNWGPCCSSGYGWNFQVKLYEGTNVVEFRYGTFGISSSGRGIGIANSTSDYQTLPSPTSTTASTTFYSSISNPASGTMYQWTPVCGTPTAGSMTATATSGCAGYTSLLTASGYSTDLGTSLQWQTSPNGSTWTNISGATNTTYTATVSSTLFYRMNVQCFYTGTSSGTSSTLLTNNTPNPITGTTSACIGATTTLGETTTGGAWSSSNAGIADVGSSSGVVSGVTAGTATISYIKAGCYATTTATVNPLPPAFSLSGGGSFCAGGSGVNVSLSGSTSGVNYQLFTGGSPVASAPGTGSSVSFGLQSTAGSYTAVATNPTTGCVNNMTGSASVAVNPVPGPITGLTTFCAGNSTTLSNSVSGGTWSSSFSGAASIGVTSGVLNGIAAGTTTITYRLAAGCFVTQLETINTAVPPIFGSTEVCQGLTTSLTNATGGGTWISTNPSRATIGLTGDVTGTGAGLDTIIYNVGPGCSTFLPFTVDPLPTVYAVTGGGQFCVGEPGVDVALANSDPSVNYDLYLGSTPVVTGVPGTGGVLDFGMMTAVGVYTVRANNPTTTCVSNMSGSATVIMNPLPDVYNVGGGGNYCSGGSGVHVSQDFSTPGISYQLYVDGVLTGAPLSGTSSGLDFGLQTTSGSYTVLATNATTSCTNNMSGSATVTINPLPNAYNVTGGGNYCSGGTGTDISIDGSDAGINYQLYHSGTPVGTLQSGTGATVSFGNQTAAGGYTVMGIDAVTGCTDNMNGSATVLIDPLPTAYTMSGGGNICAGGAGVDVILNNSDLGINYQLMNGGTSVGLAMPGTGSFLNFGPQTTGGLYTVVATNTTTSCTNTMGGITVIVNPVPDAYGITGGGDYCAGGSGVHIGLDFSAPGISYQLMRGTTPVGVAVNGAGSGIDFGVQTTAGTYSVHATNPATTCNNDMTGSVNVNINSLPTAYATTGGGSYCNGGAGMHIGLATSATGIDYQLYKGVAPVGAPINGTGASLDFGSQTASGSYTIIGTNATTGCNKNMTGSAIITINPLPTAFNVTGGGNYCAGGTGQHVGVSNSTLGIRYQLYKDLVPVGGAVNGTGAALDFGTQTAAGNYTIGAVNNTTTCANTMTGSTSIAIDALPAVYTVTGGGNYCAGGAGVHVNLTGSATGTNYQLYKDGTATGTIVSGSTGSAVDFGLQTAPGAYTAVAVNGITGCTSNMTGTTSITTIPIPAAYTVTGGGTICSGGTGVHVGISGSATGVNYQLYRSGTPVGTAVSGTGSMLDLGAQTTAGTYMVIGTSGTSTCSSNMISSANITVNPAPVAYALTGGGNYCSGGTGVHVGLSGSNLGINYQLYNGTTSVGTPWGGTGLALDFGLQTGAGTYHVVAINTTTSCNNNMSGTSEVVVNPLVAPSVTIGTSTGDNTTCAGAVTTFNATAVNGGSAPTYQWTVNGTYVGAGSSYSYIPASGDVVKATLTSNASCASPLTANTTMLMNVLTYQLPSATIASDKGNEVCNGTSVTYTATPVNGGTAPTYVWLKNSTMVGSGTTYSYTPANGDVINFMMTSNMRCRLQDSAYSNAIAMQVDAPVAPTVNITSHIGPLVGVGQWDTLKAHVTNGGSMPMYQWIVNGTEIPGANSSVYYTDMLFDGDSVACTVTTTGNCGGGTTTAGARIHLRNVGVKQVASAGSDISIVPNPSNGAFTVKGTLGTSATEQVQVEVTNMVGQVIYTSTTMAQSGSINAQVTLGNVAKGNYLVTLRSESANAVFHVVVE